MEQDSTLVTQAVDAVRGASNLDEALDSLVRLLRPRFELWYACFGSQPAGATHVTILAAWSVAESLFDAGAEFSSEISPTAQLALETLWQGRPAAFTVGTDPDSLINHLLREQGIASVLALPIHRDDRSLLVLALGSSSSDVFLHAASGFFTALSLGISESILRFATTAKG